MKKTIFIILIISIANFCSSQELEYSIGDTLSIFTKSGLNLRKLPNKESEIITKINFGNKLQIAELTINNETIEGRNGNWIKVKYEDKEGYLFSGYLTKLQVNKIDISKFVCYEHYGFLSWIESIIKEEELINSRERRFGYNNIDYKSGETITWEFYSKGTVVTTNFGYENYLYTVETFEITLNDCLNYLDYYLYITNSKCLNDKNYWKPKLDIKKNQNGVIYRVLCEEMGFLQISGNGRLLISMNVVTS